MAMLNCTPRTLRTRDSRPPSASAVLVHLHWHFRYDYLAGSLGGCGPLVPDRSAGTRNLIPALPVPVRIRGWSPWRPADSWLLFATACTRASPMILPVRIRSWLSSRTEGRWLQFLLAQTTNITLTCTPYCTMDPWTCFSTFLPV